MSGLSKLRIFGGLLDSSKSYKDYNVVGTDAEGRIHLENVNDATDTDVLTTEEVQQAFDDEVAMDGDSVPVPNNPAWKTLDNLTTVRGNNTYNPFAQKKLENAQREAFRALIEEGKDQ